MLKITETEVFGWNAAIRGMRNAHESWDKSDSGHKWEDNTWQNEVFTIGLNDLTLMKKLVAAGTDHSKFMRMIHVQCDWEAPLYWWKEADTYKVGTVRNSCSTMHKITEHEFTMDMFSHEHLDDIWAYEPEERDQAPVIVFQTRTCDTTDYVLGPEDILTITITALNKYRNMYLELKNKPTKDIKARDERLKILWWQLVQLLPSNYNQKATMDLNYQVLRNMYHARKNHKQDEWRVDFCNWVKSLPYSELITMTKEELLESVKEEY